MTNRFFCFGLGYSAIALAERLQDEGWAIAGTCRGAEKQAELTARGWSVHRFDRGMDLPDGMLDGVTHLLSSVPPDEQGDPVVDEAGGVIRRAAGSMKWIGYLSTTGVYGDRDGGWVDETSDLTPTGARGERRKQAEAAWLELGRETGVPVQLFRLAGIYGPGRNALETVRRGRAQRIDKPGQVFSRIHRDDIAAIVRASMERPNPGAAYNCCDDNPAPPQEVIAYACTLLGVEPPPLVPFEEAELSPMARSFYRDNKRVSNRRIKEELGVSLAWPDYRPALEALL
ncbi:SDR family oxidoreductase [Hwanghaeella sp.]|uniref:SDR family oxidoreductase n=1 Tax=Hwanghaeella sp. TaxID=2605943 RepID=UPI003CCB8095